MSWSLPSRRAAFAVVAAAVLLGSWLTVDSLSAQRDSFDWSEGMPSWTRSVRVTGGATTARMTPSSSGDVLGGIRHGTRLTAHEYRAVPRDSCGGFVRVTDNGWICQTSLAPSREGPHGVQEPRLPGRRLVPYRYARITRDTPSWNRPDDAPDGASASMLPRGFVIATRPFRNEEGRPRLARSLRGRYIPHDAVQFFRPSTFEGFEIEGRVNLAETAWVVRWRERFREGPNGRLLGRAPYQRRVRVLEEQNEHVRLDSGEWIAKEAMAILEPASPPRGIGSSERWIDVDLSSQTLIAYEGTTPKFATIISSGRPWRNRETDVGEFRIWVKLATATMDDTGNADTRDDYSVQGVPWVQYFNESQGFHAAFWHNSFGTRASHGCVNLSPRDARWLFEFSRPVLEPGWVSIRPARPELGTRVRVRE